jgi:hypothetical protein
VIFVAAAAAGFAWVLLAGDDGWPERIPALSAGQLTEEPTDVWLTNGGTVFNQRYSPLEEIDTSNVDQLRGVWMTNLESGTAAKYSAEGQPIFLAAASRSARARSTSGSSTATSSRSTRRRARWRGGRKSEAGGTDSRSPPRLSITTGW